MKSVCTGRKVKAICLASILVCGLAELSSARNPILAPTAFIPDGEPHVFEYKGEKRVYLYGSRDERVHAFCGYGHDVWSAPVGDLTKWRNHGEVFNVKQVQDIGYGMVGNQHFGAPDCVYNPVTKKYYLYTFLGQVYGKPRPDQVKEMVPGFGGVGPKCVMASSDSPAGPFTNPKMCDWPAENGAGTFDPAVLVDEQADGSVRVFAYWGMRKGDRCAELDPNDMRTIINPKTRKPDRTAFQKTIGDTLKEATLFEASSIRKVADGKYVFVFLSNEQGSSLTYCYGNSPEGPWKYSGIIVNTSKNWRGGNNHGGIAKIKDQWYVFYHRISNNVYNRQAMAEPIDLRIEGDKVIIPEVEMTSQGVETNGLDAFKRYNAGVACYSSGGPVLDGKQRQPDGLNPFVNIKDRSVIGYKYMNFGARPVTDKDRLELRLNIRMLQDAGVSLQVALPADANDPKKWVELGKFDLTKYMKAGEAFHDITLPVKGLDENEALKALGGLKGKLALFLEFSGAKTESCQLKEIELALDGKPTPNPLRDIHITCEGAGKGVVEALPSRGREGESIKLTVLPEKTSGLAQIKVTDERGKQVVLHENGAAPYAPHSFNFMMPSSAVRVSAEFSVEK